jgi:hypothetical protein
MRKQSEVLIDAVMRDGRHPSTRLSLAGLLGVSFL